MDSTNITSTEDTPRPFAWPNADIVLRSSDGNEFRVHKLVLSLASPVFETMFSIPQPATSTADNELGESAPSVVDMSEDAEALEGMLRECYPGVGTKAYKSLASIKKVVAVAEKYEIAGVIEKMEPLLLQAQFMHKDPLRVYAIAYRYKLAGAIKSAARLSLLHPSIEDRCPREFEDMSATAYHQLLVYRQKCTRMLDDLLWNWVDVWSKEWRGGVPAAAWQLCPGESCMRFNAACMPKLRRYNSASPWFLDHLERAKEAFKLRVDSSTLESLSLIQPTLDAIRATNCACSAAGPSQLLLFSQRLATAVNKGLDSISFPLPSDMK